MGKSSDRKLDLNTNEAKGSNDATLGFKEKLLKAAEKLNSFWLFAFVSAEGMKSKVTIIKLAALRLVRVTFGKTDFIARIEKNLWKTVVVGTGNSIYALADQSSFFIVSQLYYETEFIKKWFSPRIGETVIDIGAHIGKYTISSSKAVGGQGVVIAIEAHPENYRILERNIRLNGLKNVKAFNLAAWNEECELRIFAGDTSGHHNVTTNMRMGQISVKAKAVDDIVNELSLDRVDWVKIDVEGAECEVLRGLKQTISKYRPKIVFEVAIKNTEVALEFMQNLNHDVIRISPIFDADAYYFGFSR
mgnify:CR=1 FL=1